MCKRVIMTHADDHYETVKTSRLSSFIRAASVYNTPDLHCQPFFSSGTTPKLIGPAPCALTALWSGPDLYAVTMADVRPAESPDGADNIGLSPVGNTATAPSTKRGQNRKDERTDFEVGPRFGAALISLCSSLISAVV